MTRASRGRGKSAAAAREARAGDAAPTALFIAWAVFLACTAILMPFMPDDSFISFRYAEHLADGHGLVFNVGENPVEAYSNLLWILACSALHRAGLDLPAVTPFVGIVLGLACLYVLWTLCRRRAPLWTQQLLPLIALASFGPFALYSVSGMETALFALLLLLVVRYAEDFIETPAGPPLIGLTVAGLLASLARPEGVLAFPVAVILIAWEMRRAVDRGRVVRSLVVAAGSFAVTTALYHAWRVSYFGEWLPTPFLSKGAESSGLLATWLTNLHSYFVNWSYYSPPLGYAFVTMLLLGIAAFRLARNDAVRASGDRVAFAIAIVFGAAYLNFVDWMPGMRYHTALVGVLLVPAARLHALLPETAWRASPPARGRRFAALAFALLLAGGTGVANLKAASGKMGESANLCSKPLAFWLRDTVPPGSLLAIGDVGMVPYYSGLRTLDIHPESLTDAYIAKRSFSEDYVLGRKPHVIALAVRGVFSSRMDPLHFKLYQSEGLRQHYLFVGTVRNQWYQDRSYWVFVRNDLQVNRNLLKQLPEGIGKQRRTGFEE